MKIKNVKLYSLVLILVFGLNSCSSDSDTAETVITVSTSDFTTSINENPINGEVIGVVEGSTNQGSVTFSITEQTPSGAFAIDSSTGELSVENGEVFNFVNNPSITGVVKVANSNVSENSTITISVNETIITVTTSDLLASIDENPNNGQVIGVVEGTTNQGSVTFSITEQEPSGAFDIDSATGELTVADMTIFNYEANTSVTGIVKVANGSVFENSTINITIVDVEESATCEGPIFLGSQEEVNEFGALGCTTINGTLIIGPYGNNPPNSIVDLSPIAGITVLDGWLSIEGNLALTSIEALSSITTLTGGIEIINNPMLENLYGLDGLTINDSPTFRIEKNNSLINLEGLNNIEVINGQFTIFDNTSLTSLNGLENIQQINSLNIVSNVNLEEIEALHNLTETSSIRIANNPNLTSIEGLRSVTQTQLIEINQNTSLLNLYGLHNVTTITSALRIIQNESLNDILDFNSLSFLGGNMEIRGNTSLQNLEGLNNIQSIGGNLIINSNSQLLSLEGLNNLQSIGGILNIVSNNSLLNINALINTISLEGTYLRIENNENLTNLEGLANLNMMNLFTDLRILSNIQLSDLCGLTNLINSNIDLIQIEDNLYNPTEQDIIDGNCSQ